MQTSQKIQKKAISLFFDGKEHSCLQKRTICRRLQISIYELDQILDNYYAELDKVDVFKLMWTQVYPNSYTSPKKQSFIDFIVRKEHEKLQKSQLKENNNFGGGVSNAS